MKKLLTFLLILLSLNATAQQALGLLLLPENEYNALPHYQRTKKDKKLKMPPSLFLDAPEVGNQGNQGSCVGWGVAYTALSTVYHPTGKPWDSIDMRSPAYVYNQIKVSDCGSGTYIKRALEIIKTQGACAMKLLPYNTRDCNTQPNADQQADARKYRIWLGWNAMNPRDVELFKLRLNRKCPVIIGFETTKAFDDMWGANSGGVWAQNYGPNRGGHCVAIIGYDDIRGMFKVQNQWGKGGGDKGYFWVTYNMVRSGCFREAYTFL